MNTLYLWSEGADGGCWERQAISGTCPMHICSVWSQPARSCLLQRACPQGSRTLGQLQAFRFQPQPLKLLSSIARAVPRHRAHLNSGFGRKGPLMPLHFLCTQRLHPPQKIALELPTPDWQTPQGYFPDFFSTSRLMPDSIIFVFPMFTRRPFFSISVFHVCTFTSSSSMDSALIIRSSAYSSLCGTPWIEPLTQWWRVAG